MTEPAPNSVQVRNTAGDAAPPPAELRAIEDRVEAVTRGRAAVRPAEIPRPASPDEPPERLLLGVRAHPDRAAAEVALEAVNRLPSAPRAEYTDVLLVLLPEGVRKEIPEMVTARSQLYPMSDFAKQHCGKGQAELLLRQLARRFGDLSSETVDRVRAAEGDTLLVWADRVLDAPSLEVVLADQD